MRVCVTCGNDMKAYPRAGRSDLRYRCLHCDKMRLRDYRKDNPGFSTDKNARYKERHRQKHLAHKAVENAVATGRLIKQPCEACGERPTQAHHDDYAKPLDVRWFCAEHHPKD